MAVVRHGAVLQSLQTLFEAGAISGFSDRQLLERFLDRRDEHAFAALVHRHGPMVLELCHRVLGDRHEAEDAFQATFLVLASRAGAIQQRDSLASWLFGVARRVAARATVEAARRRAHERRAARTEAIDGSPVGDHHVLQALHEEVARLPEKYREPVVLCDLEGLTQAAAASRLGCPVGTVGVRLMRARGRLRSRLTHRGLVAPAWLAVVGLSPCVSEAGVPTILVDATVRAARNIRQGLALGAVSASVARLLHDSLRRMIVTRITIAAAGGLLALGIAAVAAARLTETGTVAMAAGPQGEAITRGATGQGKPGDESLRTKVEVPRTLTIRVVDKDGKPVDGVHVSQNHVYSIKGGERPRIENRDFWTDAEGKAVISLSGTTVDLRLWARKGGFIPLHAMWAGRFQSDGDQVPREFTFPLERGTAIGGLVVDKRSQPIEGVRIEVKDETAVTFHRVPAVKQPGLRPVRALYLAAGADAVVTDARGRWQLGDVPSDEQLAYDTFDAVRPRSPRLSLRFHHPEYRSDDTRSADTGWGDLQQEQGITLESLRGQTAKVVLSRKEEPRKKDAKTPQDSPLKVSVKEPQRQGNTPLILVRRAKLPGVVLVKCTGKVEPQEKLIIQFIRMRDRALAGQFLAERKQIGPDLFEYEVELTAPLGAGMYELEATLDMVPLPGPKPRASIMVKVVE